MNFEDRQDAYLMELERGWPCVAGLRVGPPKSAFNSYPKLFISYFPPIADDRLDLFCHGCRLLASAIVVCDRLVDEETSRSEATRILLQSQAMHYEAYGVFNALFGKSPFFWERLKSYMSAFSRSASLQDVYMSGRRSLHGLSLSEAEEIAISKTGVAKIVIAGLSILAETEHDDDLVDSIDHFNLARQLYDDLVDWRIDITAGRPSTIVASLVSRHPSFVLKREIPDLSSIGRTIYYSGLATDQINRAEIALDRCSIFVPVAGEDGWNVVIGGLRAELKSLKTDLTTIIARNTSK